MGSAMGRAEAAGHPLWEGEGLVPFQMVLEGGAMRNLFTCGVVDYFMDKRVFPESVVGTSAGAICGFNYASGAVGRMAYCNLQYRGDWRFMSLRSKLLTGNYVGSNFIFDTIPNQIEHLSMEWFAESPIKLTSVASDLISGRADYFDYDDAPDFKRGQQYLIASSSVPFVNRPVDVDDKRLLDGGVCDSIPYAHGRPHYRGRQIIVLTRPHGYWQRPARGMGFAKMLYRRYPQFLQRMQQRPDGYNAQMEQVAQLHDQGEAYAIWPIADLDISLSERNTKKLFAAYELGVETAAKQWPDIARYLGLGR